MSEQEKKQNIIKYYQEKTTAENYKGLVISFNIGERLVIIKRYPNSVMFPKSYMIQKKIVHDLFLILKKGISEHYPELLIIENEQLIPITREEEIADKKRKKEAEEKRLKLIRDTEIRQFNDNHASIFNFASNKSLYPNFVKFKPNDTTINILKKYIHDDNISELEEYFQFSPEEYFRINVKNGCIKHFDNENLNIGFMYSLNLLNNKMYSVAPFDVPKVLINLLTRGNNKNKIKSATSDPLIRQKLKKLPLRIKEQDKISFCDFIFRHVEKLVTFNPYFEKPLEFHIRNPLFKDNNKNQVAKSLNKYLEENHMTMDDFFTVDRSTAEGIRYAELCRKQLILIFSLLISKYFKIYYENNIDMAEYTQNDKTKDGSDSETPTPDKKSSGTKMMKNRT